MRRSHTVRYARACPQCYGGTYGASAGLALPSCTGACSAGYYCPRASTSPTSFACNSSAVYCPAMSQAPLLVDVGYYSWPLGGAGAVREDACAAGSYCTGGVAFACAAGRYGRYALETSPLCTGPCAAGYTCPAGSVSSYAVPCGSAAVYCPTGSAAPLPAAPGCFTVGGDGAGTTRSAQVLCPAGSWCAGGVPTLCAAGTYGGAPGLGSAACSGVCAAGFACPPRLAQRYRGALCTWVRVR